MTPKELKARLRAERLALRDAIPTDERIDKSIDMAEHAGEVIAFDPGTIVSGFLPIQSEVDIRPLMVRFRARGARLCVPAILDKLTIVFRELIPGAPLISTGFGTSGPGEDAAVLEPAIMLVPLSAFDRRGHRIGYGAGHYDHTFAHLRKSHAVTGIGLAFSVQETPAIPALSHDVALDFVLTEKDVFDFRSK